MEEEDEQPASPALLPLPQHRVGYLKTSYLGQNPFGDIVWSYTLYRDNVQSVVQLLRKQAITLTGKVVGCNPNTRELYYQAPDQPHLTALNDQTFGRSPTCLPASIQKILSLNSRLLCIGESTLTIANGSDDQHPREVFTFQNSDIPTQATLLNDRQVFFNQPQWRLFDLEYSTVVYDLKYKNKPLTGSCAPVIFQPHLFAMDVHNVDTASLDLLLFDRRQGRSISTITSEHHQKGTQHAVLLYYDSTKLVRPRYVGDGERLELIDIRNGRALQGKLITSGSRPLRFVRHITKLNSGRLAAVSLEPPPCSRGNYVCTIFEIDWDHP